MLYALLLISVVPRYSSSCRSAALHPAIRCTERQQPFHGHLFGRHQGLLRRHPDGHQGRPDNWRANPGVLWRYGMGLFKYGMTQQIPVNMLIMNCAGADAVLPITPCLRAPTRWPGCSTPTTRVAMPCHALCYAYFAPRFTAHRPVSPGHHPCDA